jgi:hypothetical protein
VGLKIRKVQAFSECSHCRLALAYDGHGVAVMSESQLNDAGKPVSLGAKLACPLRQLRETHWGWGVLPYLPSEQHAFLPDSVAVTPSQVALRMPHHFLDKPLKCEVAHTSSPMAALRRAPAPAEYRSQEGVHGTEPKTSQIRIRRRNGVDHPSGRNVGDGSAELVTDVPS